MKTKVNANTINVLMTHMRHILAPNTEVRRVSASTEGVGFYVDSRAGEKGKDTVFLSCTPTDPEEGEVEGGWNILARLDNGQFVGEWVAQGESLNADWYAAWLSVMANCTGRNYWLRFVEVEEVLA
jgi:hypothetical protein